MPVRKEFFSDLSDPSSTLTSAANVPIVPEVVANPAFGTFTKVVSKPARISRSPVSGLGIDLEPAPE